MPRPCLEARGDQVTIALGHCPLATQMSRVRARRRSWWRGVRYADISNTNKKVLLSVIFYQRFFLFELRLNLGWLCWGLHDLTSHATDHVSFAKLVRNSNNDSLNLPLKVFVVLQHLPHWLSINSMQAAGMDDVWWQVLSARKDNVPTFCNER